MTPILKEENLYRSFIFSTIVHTWWQ